MTEWYEGKMKEPPAARVYPVVREITTTTQYSIWPYHDKNRALRELGVGLWMMGVRYAGSTGAQDPIVVCVDSVTGEAMFVSTSVEGCIMQMELGGWVPPKTL